MLHENSRPAGLLFSWSMLVASDEQLTGINYFFLKAAPPRP